MNFPGRKPGTSERCRVGLKMEEGSREHCPIKEAGGILGSLRGALWWGSDQMPGEVGVSTT